ncbi:dolichyl-diphosphooligosaccharide--protein glycosyltransferase subunit DAD1 isoform X1 [Brassica napus]|uniref:dolichyl-diphosphooligosaccharide--protein glycosyltransferase subunit DAD1 isoform X1 n=1 Tax=Brassica napus TaxID=3708 RepID=UPI002078D955|nr:dolichyl-diphosphooligosaccharide--protein glycosyltransferase subunit DAD1 isoform X1 [Brassica napus]
MVKSTSKDAQDLFRSLHSAYSATPTNLKIIDLYVVFAVFTALIQVAYMALVGSFPFNSFLSGVLSCVGTAVLAVCLRIQVNKENKEFKVFISEQNLYDNFIYIITIQTQTYTLVTQSNCIMRRCSR